MAERLTPLARRLAAVGLSLRTWLLYCRLGAFVGVTCLVAAVLVQGCTEFRLRSKVPFPAALGPEATIGAPGAGGNVAPEEARSVTIYPASAAARLGRGGAALGERQQQVFVPLPKAERVVLHAPFTGEHLRWLAAQPRLTALTVMMTDDQSIPDLRPLSASSSLRSLRVVMNNAGDGDGAPMAWPPNLELLDLQGAEPLTRQRLEELSRLPHLHTLAVRLHAPPASPELSDEVTATLLTFPALRHLYVAGTLFGLPRLVTVTQRSLPELQVQPSTYDRSPTLLWWALILCLVMGQWIAILNVLPWPQFVTPSSVLLPGYRTPHVAAGVTLFAVGLVTVVVQLRFAGLDWLIVWCLCGGAVVGRVSMALTRRAGLCVRTSARTWLPRGAAS